MKARTLITLLVAALVTVSGAWGQTTKNLSQFSELPEAPNAADWFYMWDTSAGVSKKISPANLFGAMPNPGLTTLGGVKRNVGTAGQFVTGIDSDGSLLYDTPAGGPGGGITLTGSRVPYGDGAGSYTHEAAFYYDASNDKLVVGALGLGAAAQLGVTGGGAFQFYNVTATETLNLSVSPGGNNIATWDSSTGINVMDTGSIELRVPTEVYNATAWNGDPSVPTKDAIRDALVALPTGGDVSAASVFSADNALLRSDGAGTKGVQASGITVDDSNNVSGVGSLSASSVGLDTASFLDSDASHSTTINFGSNLTSPRSLDINTGDADRTLSINGDATISDWFNQSVKTSASPSFASMTLSGTLTAPNADHSAGTTTIGPLQTSDGVPLLNERTVYGSGTAFPLPGVTPAAVDSGVTDPVITINSAGTYIIEVRVLLNYAAAVVASETATIKLRRTNNSAADVTGATTTIDLPVAGSALTHSYGVVILPPVIYTTTNTDDSLTIFGSVSASLSSGSIQVTECSIVALRIR